MFSNSEYHEREAELQAEIGRLRTEITELNGELARMQKARNDAQAAKTATTTIARLREATGVVQGAPADAVEDDGCECPGAHECGITTSTARNSERAEQALLAAVREYDPEHLRSCIGGASCFPNHPEAQRDVRLYKAMLALVEGK